MFKNLGTWLGIENENGQVKEDSESKEIVKGNDEDTDHGVNKPTAGVESEQSSEKDAQTAQLLEKARGFSGKFCCKLRRYCNVVLVVVLFFLFNVC